MLAVDVIAVAREGGKGLALAAAVVPRPLGFTFQLRNLGEDTQGRPDVRRGIECFLHCQRPLSVAPCLRQTHQSGATCLHFVLQQAGEVVEDGCLLRTTGAYALVQLQRPLIPAFGLGGAISQSRDISKLVAGGGSTDYIALLLVNRQGLAVAALGLGPLFLLLRNPTQLMPYNSLHCRFT